MNYQNSALARAAIATFVVFWSIGTYAADKGTIEKTKAVFQREVQVQAVVYQPGQAVEWKLVVFADRYFRSDGTLDYFKDLDRELKTKGWNGYAMAMCNTLYQTGYLKKDSKQTSVIRIVDATTLERKIGHWREASVGSCDCRKWVPFD